MFEPTDHEDLITFLYQIPFAVARMDPNGELGMANPKTMQLMLQMSPGATNLLEALALVDPKLVETFHAYGEPAGVIIQEAKVNFGVRGRKKKFQLVVALTITKLSDEKYMAVLRDESVPLEAPPLA